jgi:hypothetical protein
MTSQNDRHIPTERSRIGAVILWGAAMNIPGRKLADFNPFPDMPGYMVLRKAFAYGWNNSRQVLWEHECPGEPMPPPNSLLW